MDSPIFDLAIGGGVSVGPVIEDRTEGTDAA